ncbi:hypothetical protein WQ53_01645 [Pseudoxanthomonas suwonensis]|uniref:Uncharacterized protein n=1 Tax=Pseudoxanthomonas suwonensis TaxID=314722 RepID=A0A0E3UM32_9GAMM|nr:hypothetical protein WQ53_01645 [Pseudoxanthomonas suwonensis]
MLPPRAPASTMPQRHRACRRSTVTGWPTRPGSLRRPTRTRRAAAGWTRPPPRKDRCSDSRRCTAWSIETRRARTTA